MICFYISIELGEKRKKLKKKKTKSEETLTLELALPVSDNKNFKKKYVI